MVKLVVVNGAPGCGKTTFEQMCVQLVGEGNCRIFSTIDIIKDAARVLGWDGTKTPENRKFLSDLKDLATQWNNVSFKSVQQQLNKIDAELRAYDVDDIVTVYLMVDSREPEEIKKFVDELDAVTVLVRRQGANTIISNHADANVENYDYDYIINNDGNLDDLKDRARAFMYVLKNS